MSMVRIPKFSFRMDNNEEEELSVLSREETPGFSDAILDDLAKIEEIMNNAPDCSRSKDPGREKETMNIRREMTIEENNERRGSSTSAESLLRASEHRRLEEDGTEDAADTPDSSIANRMDYVLTTDQGRLIYRCLCCGVYQDARNAQMFHRHLLSTHHRRQCAIMGLQPSDGLPFLDQQTTRSVSSSSSTPSVFLLSNVVPVPPPEPLNSPYGWFRFEERDGRGGGQNIAKVPNGLWTMLKSGDGSCDINDDTIPSYDLDAARTSYFAHLESERATILPLSNSIGRSSTRTLSKRTAQDLINDPDVMAFKRRRYQDNADGDNDDAIYRPSMQLNDDTDEAFCHSLAIHLRSLPEPIRTGTRLKLQQVMARTVVEMNNGNRFEPRQIKQEEPIKLD